MKLPDTENFIHNKYGYCYYSIPLDGNPLIYGLYVEPEYRLKGHAKWLLNYVIDQIIDTGWNGEIEVEVVPGESGINPEGLERLYIGLGLTIRKGN